jgi:Domain of unknown function (DUF4838)
MSRKCMKRIAVLLLLSFMSWPSFASSPLFENEKSDWKIYCSSQDNNGRLSYAAKELQRALKKVSKADFTIITQPVKDRMIVIGVDLESGNPDKISIVTRDGNLYLSGGSPSSAQHAVYAFLRRELGVRWLWPGKDGEFIPAKASWTLPKLNYSFTPKIRYRGFHLCNDWRDVANFRIWMTRNFINTWRHGRNRYIRHLGLHHMISSHNAKLDKKLFEEHPEYFARIEGKYLSSQICFSNPHVDKLVLERFERLVKGRPELEILSIFPPDNQEYCQCPKCAAKGTSTSWFDFYNRLTDKLKVSFPKLKFATIAYQGYIDVPANLVRNSEFVEYATYPRCNIHTFGGKCERNNQMLVAMKKWQATGVPMGNYGYEFDIFSGNYYRFLPFFSMIDDAIKMDLKLEHIAVITEVPLRPKGGPDIKSFVGRNRLPLYLYAQLLWNPQAKMKDLLRDWCNTVYGKAADPMFRYFVLLDSSWSGMKQHRTILGSSISTAKELLSASLQKEVKRLFAEADRALNGKKNPHVEYEKVLYNQWLSLLSNHSEVNLPKLASASDFEKSFFSLPQVDIKAAWSPDALYFRDIVPPFKVSLGNGIGGEVCHFEVNKDGKQSAYRISSVGIRDSRWNPKWSFKKDTAIIPFALFGELPDVSAVWQINVENNGKAFPKKDIASLRFSSLAQTGRSILWWAGGKPGKRKKEDMLRHEFLKTGWQLRIIRDAKDLRDAKPLVYYFNHPKGPNKVPMESFAPVLDEVKAGAMAIFCSYWQMPLEKYFDDPSFKVNLKSIKNLPLSKRHTRYSAPDVNWASTPNRLRRLRDMYTPAYGFMPEDPGAWKVIATMDLDGKQPGKTIPYILARPYGKGLVLVLGAKIPASAAKLVDNFYANRQELLNAPDVKK